MIDYGRTKSAVRPDEVEITESKVFVASDIKEITVTMEDAERQEFEFNLVEYDKDEYTRQIHEEIESERAIIDILLGKNEAPYMEDKDKQKKFTYAIYTQRGVPHLALTEIKE